MFKMKKFTKLNESKKTVETSIDKQDFIKNLIEETLSVDNGEIKGKDILAESINKILNINDSKTTINVLENVKLKSYHNLNIEWINSIIEGEKTKINETKSEPKVEEHVETEEHVEMINESVQDEVIEDEVINNDLEGSAIENEIEEETQPTSNGLLSKEDFEIGDTVYINLEGQTEAEIIAMDDNEIILNKVDDEDSKDIKLTWEEFNEIIDKEKVDDFIDPIEDEVEEDIFMEKVNYMNDIDHLSKLMESISDETLNEEHHLETKEERIDYILSKMDDDDIADAIITKVSKLPDYVKNSDIEKTLKNMSDKEIENLYKEVEKIEGVD